MRKKEKKKLSKWEEKGKEKQKSEIPSISNERLDKICPQGHDPFLFISLVDMLSCLNLLLTFTSLSY